MKRLLEFCFVGLFSIMKRKMALGPIGDALSINKLKLLHIFNYQIALIHINNTVIKKL